jgi:type II secretory pathway component PulJ
MRKGFNLVEMLIVIITIPVIVIVLDKTLINTLRDIPRSSSVVQENTTLLNMLGQLRNDVEQADNLPESFDGLISNDEILLVETTDVVIFYRKENGEIIKSQFTKGQRNDNIETRVWSLPNSEVTWQVWRENSRGYAVEIISNVKLKLRKKLQEKMANSHVFFVGAY